MKTFLAAVLTAIPGILLAVVLWTLLGVFLIVVYWIGFQFFYVGFLCSKGKFGLGVCTPPGQPTLNAIDEVVMLGTAIWFTWGEVLAALVGAFCGSALGVALRKLYTFVKRIARRRTDPPLELTEASIIEADLPPPQEGIRR